MRKEPAFECLGIAKGYTSYCICIEDGQRRFDTLTEGLKSGQICRDLYEDDLRTQANFDTLTGFRNLRSLEKIYEELTEKEEPFGVIFCDIRNFKSVNDTAGHQAGNYVLSMFADHFRLSVRDADEIIRTRREDSSENESTLIRFGGDEFILLLRAGVLTEPHITSIAERIRMNITSDPYVTAINAELPEGKDLDLRYKAFVYDPKHPVGFNDMLSELNPKPEPDGERAENIRVLARAGHIATQAALETKRTQIIDVIYSSMRRDSDNS